MITGENSLKNAGCWFAERCCFAKPQIQGWQASGSAFNLPSASQNTIVCFQLFLSWSGYFFCIVFGPGVHRLQQKPPRNWEADCSHICGCTAGHALERRSAGNRECRSNHFGDWWSGYSLYIFDLEESPSFSDIIFAQVEPPQLDSTFAPKKLLLEVVYSFVTFGDKISSTVGKMCWTFRGASKMQDAM